MSRKQRVATAIAKRTMERRLGQVLRESREGRGWSRERVARAAGVSVSTVWRYEVGGTPQSTEHLTAILAALEVTIDEAMARVAELVRGAAARRRHGLAEPWGEADRRWMQALDGATDAD